MKKFIFTLLIIYYSFVIANCQSSTPYTWSVPVSPVIQNLTCINSLGTFIAGDNGTILTYNGTNWNQVVGIPIVNFKGICNSIQGNLQRITVVGSFGTVFSTDDGFATWSQQITGIGKDLYAVSSSTTSSPSVFKRIAVGADGTIIKSTLAAGGAWTPWTAVVSPVTQKLNSIYLNSNLGWACGNNGTIIKSTDMGETWVSVSSGTNEVLNSIYFKSDNLSGFAAGNNGVFLNSTNGGTNWTPVNLGVTANLYSVNSKFLCGASGTIFQSTNSGTNWCQAYIHFSNDFNFVAATGDIAGTSGLILKAYPDNSFRYKILSGNNISSYFENTGIFDQNNLNGNSAGFEWPAGSQKTAVFTAGLSICGLVNGQLRQAMASYLGEYSTGAINNSGAAYKDLRFKFYSVKRGDSWQTNLDWQNWGLMVPYGAPYIDVNRNGVYDYQIDTPGVRNASQTIFVCLTDGFPSSHTVGEGLGGGTSPLNAELHLTAWTYNTGFLADVQFIKFAVVNKNSLPWTHTYFSIFSDPDLGYADDDYIGCDTIRNLGYCYNGDNQDGNGDPPTYGLNPPAVGFLLLKGPYNKNSTPPANIKMTSFDFMYGTSTGTNYCETDANGEPQGAYFYMKGYKKDSTSWLDNSLSPRKKTFYNFYGDPETNSGWTKLKGRIENCGGDTTGYVLSPVPPFDERMFVNFGAENLTIMPGDTQKIYIAQLIARGSSNTNSVTKLKQLADSILYFYNNNLIDTVNYYPPPPIVLPADFYLYQNYPNPFNPSTTIKFDVPQQSGGGTVNVTIKIFDLLGREVQTLINRQYSGGTYTLTFDGTGFPAEIYFYQMRAGDYISTKKLVLLK